MRVLPSNIVLINALGQLLQREFHEVNHSTATECNVYVSQSRPHISPSVSVSFTVLIRIKMCLMYRIIVLKWHAWH